MERSVSIDGAWRTNRPAHRLSRARGLLTLGGRAALRGSYLAILPRFPLPYSPSPSSSFLPCPLPRGCSASAGVTPRPPGPPHPSPPRQCRCSGTPSSATAARAWSRPRPREPPWPGRPPPADPELPCCGGLGDGLAALGRRRRRRRPSPTARRGLVWPSRPARRRPLVGFAGRAGQERAFRWAGERGPQRAAGGSAAANNPPPLVHHPALPAFRRPPRFSSVLPRRPAGPPSRRGGPSPRARVPGAFGRRRLKSKDAVTRH